MKSRNANAKAWRTAPKSFRRSFAKNLPLSALLTSLALLLANRATAQTFKVLHPLDRPVAGNGDGGTAPTSCLVISSNVLYGTDSTGGLLGYQFTGNGVIFRINIDGTGYTNLHLFAGGQAFFPLGADTNSDGTYPRGSMVLSGNTLYGSTAGGTPTGCGGIFAINTDGTGFTNLHVFSGADGWSPDTGLTLSGNVLYGTTVYGGTNEWGTVFAINTDGTGFTNLYYFTNDSLHGYFPDSTLVVSNNTLFGRLYAGAGSFSINTDGTGYTAPAAIPLTRQNALGNILFGTSSLGGTWNEGTIYALSESGTTNTLFSFGDGTGNSYNTATATSPNGVILSGYALYGTTSQGGGVFSLSFLPQLSITPSETNVILAWPTNVAGFDYSRFSLQSSTNPASTAVWSNVSPGAVIANGQNTVTNPITGTQQFYRLIQ